MSTEFLGTPTQLTEYVRLLGQHDWSFEFSDDHRVYWQGRGTLQTLRDMQKTLDPSGAVWNEHCPTQHRRVF